MSRFQPPICPFDDCPSRTRGAPFLWRRRGTYPRKCDGRRAQRFFCRSCRRSFSAQCFRLDHRLRLPDLQHRLLPLFIAKVTMRQAARQLGVDRKTVAHRLRLLGGHCLDLHRWLLARSPGLSGTFQLDELETFETDRILKPVTVPVLIHKDSWFVVDLTVGTLPPRGPKSRHGRRKRSELEPRRSESRERVESCFRFLAEHAPPRALFCVQTDRKTSYGPALRRTFGDRVLHQRFSSKAPRKPGAPLFRINHTLALMRDGISRLVRRTWAVSKDRHWLLRHLWIWAVWRNLVRPATVVRPGDRTPAEKLGLLPRRWTAAELLRWKVAYRAALDLAA